MPAQGPSSTRITEFELSSERIAKFLELGLRPIKHSDSAASGDIVAAFLLVPTKTFKFEELYESEWEGSYIPFIVYRTATAAIMVPYGEEKKWLRLANHIEAITLLKTEVRGD